MVFFALYRHRQLLSVSIQSNYSYLCSYFLLSPNSASRWFSSSRTESFRTEFPLENAYEILGVGQTCSFTDIKTKFRKLAKETHPDLAASNNDSSASKRFVQILAAYEILSDTNKRAHYDEYLLSQRTLMEEHSRHNSTLHMYKYQMKKNKQMEVVEWLKWYRFAINDIVSEKKVIVGTGYFDVLQADLYSAIHAAYYGPLIESMEFLPRCFEAEERSVYDTPEVLHLVSGRDLFGMVCLVDKIPRLSFSCNQKLASAASGGLGVRRSAKTTGHCLGSDVAHDIKISPTQINSMTSPETDAYKDLELHVSGKVVAVATRTRPKSSCDGSPNEDAEDHIHIFLNKDEVSTNISRVFIEDSVSDYTVGSRIRLGTITGLGTSPEEGSCSVYNSSGSKTHIVMKHRTLLVKHMHWYQVGDEVSVCECRCSREKLPPSKFWLFEPRCDMHDIGGWYVETFGRDYKGRRVPSQRYWDGLDTREALDKRLHPAIYLFALAYRTLDLEDAKRRQTVWDIFGLQLYRILSWCKNLV